jgi:molybdate transport system substrate-binding protein
MRTSRLILLFVLISLAAHSLFAAPPAVTLTISAAISLKQSVEAIEKEYQRIHPEITFRNNFGASGTLAVEIENGAPVDIFLSAALRPMDELEAKHLLAAGTRRNLLRNQLVLIAPAGSSLAGFPGLTNSQIRFIAIGEPNSVPAGEYALATLQALNLADQLKPKFVYARDVRQVLAYVETGNADAGFVYATDAKSSLRAKVIARVPPGSHPDILYPGAVLVGTHAMQEAKSFNDFLVSRAASDTFDSFGFTALRIQ